MELERSRTRITLVFRLEEVALAGTILALTPKIGAKCSGTETDAVTVTCRIPELGKETAA
jgi:hypothetical protein